MERMNENVNECAIEWVRGENEATVTAYSNSRLKNKIAKLSEEFPDGFKIIHENEDGSILAHIPISCVRIARPVKMSEERKKELSDRMREYTNGKRETE